MVALAVSAAPAAVVLGDFGTQKTFNPLFWEKHTRKYGTQTKKKYNREKCIYQVYTKYRCILRINVITAEHFMHLDYFLPKLKYWYKCFAAKPERDF